MRLFLLILTAGIFLITLTTCTKDIGPSDAYSCSNLPHNWATDIQPVINTYCAVPGCHDSGFPTADFTTYTGIKAKYDAGALMTRLITLGNMPPTTATPLPPLERKRIQCWMEEGAPQN